jgi:hypothetical protein
VAVVAHKPILLLDKMVVVEAVAPVVELVRKPLELAHQGKVLLVRLGLMEHTATLAVAVAVLVLLRLL